MTVEITPVLRHAWQGQAPGITDDEIRLLLPIVQSGGSWVLRLLRAYRAGVAVHDPAQQPDTVSGDGCPVCGSTSARSLLWQVVQRDERVALLAGVAPYAVMWTRCAACDAVYRAATGEVWPRPVDGLLETEPTAQPTTDEIVRPLPEGPV